VLKIKPVSAFLPLLFLLLPFAGHSQDWATAAISGCTENASTGIDRGELIAFAKQFVGTPYRRAGADPKKGFDCSGFVSYIFRHFNIILPRSSREYKSLGTTLKPEEFKVGDVIVFYGFRDRSHIGHVGIICEADGMNSRFIHASSGKVHSVTISRLAQEGYRARFYKCINRIQ